MCRRGEQWREQIELLRTRERELPDLWRVVDQVRFGAALEIVRRRLGDMRLRGGKPFFRHQRLRSGPLDDWPDWLTGVAVIGIDPRLLRHLEQAGDLALAADVDVHEDRRRWGVVIPDVVVHQ